MYYFAYGSNMLTYRLTKRVGEVKVIGIGKITGAILKLNKLSNDGSLKANLAFTQKRTDEIIGVVFEIDPKNKEKLDRAEGLGKGYSEETVEVQSLDATNQWNATTYIGDKAPDTNGNAPYDWYMDFIIRGAKEHRLPMDYLTSLASIETKKDNDTTRALKNKILLSESGAIPKEVRTSFQYVFDFEKKREFEINLGNHALNHRKIIIEKADKHFAFSTDSQIPVGHQTHRELEVSSETITLNALDGYRSIIVKGNYLLINNIEYDMNNHLKLLSGKINACGTSLFENVVYMCFRLMIPVAKEISLKLFRDYQCQRCIMDKQSGNYLLSFSLSKRTFHFFGATFQEQQFIFIDCLSSIRLKEFQDCCHSILLTYALLSGEYHAGEAFYLGFKSNSFASPDDIFFNAMADSRLNLFGGFTTNSLLGIEREDVGGEKTEQAIKNRRMTYGDLKFFPSSVFGNLCQISVDHEKILRSLLHVIFNQSSSLEIKIPSQFVALEALTAAIVSDGNAGLKPLADKPGNDLVKQLKELTKKFLTDHGIATVANDTVVPIFKKLDALNTPTNVDKLTKAFSELNYAISDEEKQMLKLRNTFLHGSTKTYKDPEKDFKELFHLSLRLHFLICVLLLKKSGYSGRIINYAKLYEYITEKYSEEDILKKI